MTTFIRSLLFFAKAWRLKFAFLFLLGIMLGLFPNTAFSQWKEVHVCAAARIKSGPQLLEDGFTSEPHRDLMNQYDVHYYKLDIQVERNSLQIEGNVLIAATARTNSLQEFAFELHPDLEIQQVLIDGVASEVTRSGGEAIAKINSPKNNQQPVQVQVFYAGKAPSGASAAIGNGLNTAIAQPWGAAVTWSLSEPFAAYEWFPVKQILADKADSVEVWVTTDATNKVGSNGILQRITPMPGNRHRYEWKSNYPIAYYLISVAVGQYQEYSFNVPIAGIPRPVLVQNYIYDHPQAIAFYKTGVDRTGPFLQLFSELFGPYPFHQEKYGHSMAPLGGGMEHQTMTTQQDFEFSLTAHELAHQWWGDEVTNAGWSHIWLNEGFATYSEFLAIDAFFAEQKTNWLNRVTESALSQPQGQVFVEDSLNVNRIFNSALTYRKAGMVLHMLRRALGSDALFFQVLQAYREEFRYRVATTRDFQRVVERVSGWPFGYFFDQWIYGEGFPVFTVTWNQVGDRLYLKSQQTTSSAATPFFRTNIEYKIITSLKDTVVVVTHDEPLQHISLKVAGTVNAITIDPDQWLLEKSPAPTFDATLEEPVIEALAIFPNPTLGEMRLKGGEGLPQRILILDMLGRKVEILYPLSTYVNVQGLRPGAYFLQAEYLDKTEILRFIKL